jgi:hypothetical protein
MRIIRDRNQDLATLIDELRRMEIDASAACNKAVEALPDEPLTRGQLLSMLSEHEYHRAALEEILTKLPRVRSTAPTGLLSDASAFEGRRGSTAFLRIIRKNAELAVRRYQAALGVVPAALEPIIRAHTNVWLRHRAWLTARIEAFSRARDSHPSVR